MKNKKNILLASILLVSSIFIGCNKNNLYDTTIPTEQSSFLTATGGTYYVKNDPNSVFKIPVGGTTISAISRNVTISVVSPTGAVSGTQYTLPSTTVTIPAGNAVDSLSVKGIFAGFPGARIDTLLFTIAGGDLKPSDYNPTYKLVMRKYCDVVSTNLVGNYANTRDYDKTTAGAASAAKYNAAISNWTATSATTATVLIKNLCGTADIGFLPFAASDPATTGLTAVLDWTNPANFTVTIASQPYVSSLYTYGASTISGTGTFSSCDQTFTITTTVRVAAGAFTAVASTLIR